ncbi:acyl-CoA dehydrogenase family protein [Nocardia asteroides]|uniref:acyl-CoA dehydrogenase family protein n=1 Tax=Nocardia asteroides TaxID=1824 RepID=UPI001E2EBF9B|nr:acyl-CoA dehydrogenase family protein [Nocardia asteroides]UGT60339.1 acyl-CoA dehydrogenase [Nocardia asteroides]
MRAGQAPARDEIPADEASTWPLPGHGATGTRWQALTTATRADIVIGRLTEAHADACAITRELGAPPPRPGELWGVWAAEPPEPVLRAHTAGGRTLLSGRKPWCSGAGICTHALVTAETGSGAALFAVDVSAPGVAVLPGSWHGVGMTGSATLSVDFDAVPALLVGAPGAYVGRPGFWHGAIGVSACWLGAAQAVAEPLLTSGRDDPITRAHRGAVDAALYSAHSALTCAATEIDADPADIRAARIRARRVRAIVETAAADTIDRVGRALGAAPLAHDRVHAQRVADLTLYLRQSHAEHDLADLGALVARS